MRPRGLYDEALGLGIRFRSEDGRLLDLLDACEYLARRTGPAVRDLAFAARVLKFEGQLVGRGEGQRLGREGCVAASRFLQIASLCCPGPTQFDFRQQLLCDADWRAYASAAPLPADLSTAVYPSLPDDGRRREVRDPQPWIPSPHLQHRAPPHPFRASSGPVRGSFAVLPGLLVVGPDPSGDAAASATVDRCGFRIVAAGQIDAAEEEEEEDDDDGGDDGDDAIRRRLRLLDPLLLEGPPLYVYGADRTTLAYMLARIYGLSAAAASATLARLAAAAVGRSPLPGDETRCARMLRRDLGPVDTWSADPGSQGDEPDEEDGLLRAAFDACLATQRHERFHTAPPFRFPLSS